MITLLAFRLNTISQLNANHLLRKNRKGETLVKGEGKTSENLPPNEVHINRFMLWVHVLFITNQMHFLGSRRENLWLFTELNLSCTVKKTNDSG